MLLYWV